MPVTRSRSSLSVSSHSQSQTQSLPSAYAATLPPKYLVHLYLPASAALTDAERTKQYARGEEMLSDGWRRRVGEEGRIGELRREGKRRRVRVRPVGWVGEVDDVAPQDRKGKGKALSAEANNKDGVLGKLWYTAEFRIPCSCELARLPRSFKPSALPPLASSLEASPTVDVGALTSSSLLDWSEATVQTELDDLEEFEAGWPAANGQWGRGWGRAAQEDVEGMATGHANVTEGMASTSQMRSTEEQWQEEAKRRKSWWRKEIGREESYSTMWEVVPRPHDYDPPPPVRSSARDPLPPPYNLPRFFTSAAPPSHPYHPSLSHFLSSNPHARVYWLLPIHGPVLLPSLHPLPPPPIAQTPQVPSPSGATLSSSLPSPPPPPTKPQTLRWTPALLNHFLHAFFLPLQKSPSNPFGPLSLRLSGPKPDPFLDLPAAQPLTRHVQVQVEGGRPPDRVEAGDHMRVYVDAGRALAFRTWLHGVEVDLAALGEGGPAGSGERRGRDNGKGKAREGEEEEKALAPAGKGLLRVFDKVRLALVGERGEVLVVA